MQIDSTYCPFRVMFKLSQCRRLGCGCPHSDEWTITGQMSYGDDELWEALWVVVDSCVFQAELLYVMVWNFTKTPATFTSIANHGRLADSLTNLDTISLGFLRRSRMCSGPYEAVINRNNNTNGRRNIPSFLLMKHPHFVLINAAAINMEHGHQPTPNNTRIWIELYWIISHREKFCTAAAWFVWILDPIAFVDFIMIV